MAYGDELTGLPARRALDEARDAAARDLRRGHGGHRSLQALQRPARPRRGRSAAPHDRRAAGRRGWRRTGVPVRRRGVRRALSRQGRRRRPSSTSRRCGARSRPRRSRCRGPGPPGDRAAAGPGGPRHRHVAVTVSIGVAGSDGSDRSPGGHRARRRPGALPRQARRSQPGPDVKPGRPPQPSAALRGVSPLATWFAGPARDRAVPRHAASVARRSCSARAIRVADDRPRFRDGDRDGRRRACRSRSPPSAATIAPVIRAASVVRWPTARPSSCRRCIRSCPASCDSSSPCG